MRLDGALSTNLNRVAPLAAAPSTLPNGLKAWWSMEEESGGRVDSIASLSTDDINTVLFTASGKIGNAATFVRANSEKLRVTNANMPLNIGTENYTVAFWFYNTSLTGFQKFVTQGTTDMGFRRENAASTLRFYVGNTFITAQAFTQDAWHLAIGWLDTDNKPRQSIDDGTIGVGAEATPANGGSRFVIGADDAGSYMDGHIDMVGLWNRVLTADERTELYNAGAGKNYPFS